jgi:hypothetical protein
MKISKIVIAAMFAAGFLTVSATPGMATSCAEGYKSITLENGMYSCEAEELEVNVDDLKPIDSCWTTEDGLDVCARGGMVPSPATVEDTPIDSDCSVTTDDQGISSEVCMKAVPLSGSTGEDDGVAYLEDGPVDDTLMFQSGEAKTLATPADPTVSNAVAIFAVVAGALWALVIVMNRRKEAK